MIDHTKCPCSRCARSRLFARAWPAVLVAAALALVALGGHAVGYGRGYMYAADTVDRAQETAEDCRLALSACGLEVERGWH